MSSRRAARARQAAESSPIPPELASRLHPIWRDVAGLLAHPELGRYVDERDVRRIRMGNRPHQSVRNRWALAHGYESTKRPGFVDEHRLRADIEAAALEVDDDSQEVSGNGRTVLTED